MLFTPLADLLIGLRFFSRLPLPVTARETALGARGLAGAVLMVPVAGAVIGLLAALVFAGVSAAGLSPAVAAPLAIAALVMITGALHEDGLADCADGFGGGRTRARKLEIMRDSRIGTYGACAIGLSLYIRAASLAVIAAHGIGPAVAVLVAGAALSRTLCLLPLVLLPAARIEGAGAAVAGIDHARFEAALLVSGVIGFAPLGAGFGLIRCGAALALAGGAAIMVCVVARRAIGGQTGDVAGAAQQMVELTVLVTFAAGVGTTS